MITLGTRGSGNFNLNNDIKLDGTMPNTSWRLFTNEGIDSTTPKDKNISEGKSNERIIKDYLSGAKTAKDVKVVTFWNMKNSKLLNNKIVLYENFLNLPDAYTNKDFILVHNYMMDAYRKAGKLPKAEEIYNKIKDTDIADVATHTTMITIYGKTGELPKAEEIYDKIKDTKLADTVTYHAMMTIYGKTGELLKAKEIYDKIRYTKLADVIIHITMITIYANAGQYYIAAGLINEVKEDIFTKNLGLTSDELNLHKEQILSNPDRHDDPKRGIGLGLAKSILMYHILDDKKISTIIVGQHGENILKDEMLKFIKVEFMCLNQKVKEVKVNEENLGRLELQWYS